MVDTQSQYVQEQVKFFQDLVLTTSIPTLEHFLTSPIFTQKYDKPLKDYILAQGLFRLCRDTQNAESVIDYLMGFTEHRLTTRYDWLHENTSPTAVYIDGRDSEYNEDHISPLTYAFLETVGGGNLKHAQHLLGHYKNDIDLFAMDYDENTVLALAGLSGNLDMVKFIMATPGTPTLDYDDYSAFEAVCYYDSEAKHIPAILDYYIFDYRIKTTPEFLKKLDNILDNRVHEKFQLRTVMERATILEDTLPVKTDSIKHKMKV